MKQFIYIAAISITLLSQSSCSIFHKSDKNRASSTPDTLVTDSGLKYIIRTKGTGVKPEKDARVKVHYIGKLLNDTIFDSSYKRNQPFSFTLGKRQVIKGWDEGIALLNQGDKATFIIPPNLGYGSRAKGKIPANSTLIFDIELIEVENPIKIEPYDVKGKDTLTRPSGLKYIVVKEGSKKESVAQSGEIVTVHYTGYFSDGMIFDSSVKRKQPIKFTLGIGQVIKGWDEGLQLMRPGDKFHFIVPYQLAYGEKGRGNVIPPKADLIFDVELLHKRAEIKVKPYNSKGKDTIVTESGLMMIPVKTTLLDSPQIGQLVTVHYSGYLENGKMFDSSVKRDRPFQFKVGLHKVISGWDEAILRMKKGEKYRLIIPPNLAYGSRGAGNQIPPNSTLIFDVELIDFK